MSLRSAPLSELAIPDDTHVREHDLVTDGDVVVGGQSTVSFGLRGRNVVAGERVRVGGQIEAERDCRLDMWCDVDGDVLVGEDAYLGERVHVGGRLKVAGDLDIGDDVSVDEGFDANGWILVRNPMPTVVFLVVYLSHLLRVGEEEAAEELLDEATVDDGPDPLLVPRGATVTDDAWQVSTPASVGDDCRLHGNLRAHAISLGSGDEVFGSLRARENVHVGSGSEVHGDVTTRGGTVHLAPGATVRGDVACEDLRMDRDARVDGAIRARGTVEMQQEKRAGAD